jgi:hypothetical protein
MAPPRRVASQRRGARGQRRRCTPASIRGRSLCARVGVATYAMDLLRAPSARARALRGPDHAADACHRQSPMPGTRGARGLACAGGVQQCANRARVWLPRPQLGGPCVLLAWSCALPVDAQRPCGGRECASMRHSAHAPRVSCLTPLACAPPSACSTCRPACFLGSAASHTSGGWRTSVGAAAGCARHARESSPRHRQPCLGI